MNDLGSLLFFLATMALLSLMDALTRRARQRRMEQMERAERREAPRAEEVETLPREIWVPIEIEEEWAGEDRVGEQRAAEQRAAEEPAPPPLVAAAEELREAGRKALQRAQEAVAAPTHRPAGAVQRPEPAVATRAARLRVELRGGDAQRRAVLYREILGEPLGLRRGPGGWDEPGRT